MSDFQVRMKTKLPNSVAGELASSVPSTGISLPIDSPTESNMFGGAAICYSNEGGVPVDSRCTAGGEGVFIGIACHSKSMIGGSVQDGEQFFALQNSTIHIITSGTVHIIQSMPLPPLVGNSVLYSKITGQLATVPSGASVSPDWVVIKGAQVVYANGLITGDGSDPYVPYTCAIRLTGEG